MPARLQSFLQRHIPSGCRLLVAVSGGPDSIALAHALRALPYKVYVGHVDHQLRAGSVRDRRFVERMARGWAWPCMTKRLSVRAWAQRHGIGLEEAARKQRYEALGSMAQRLRCRAVLTAHTANDQAETVLMNFFRGAGPAGLAGIPPVRPLVAGRSSLRLLRPLLNTSREEIMRYVGQERLPYRSDPSNRSLVYRRNRIRHETLPYLEQFYPGLSRRLGESAQIFRDEEALWSELLKPKLRKTVRKINKRVLVDLKGLFGYHKVLGRRILRSVLPGLSFQDIERILTLARSSHTGPIGPFGNGLLVERRGSRLVVVRNT